MARKGRPRKVDVERFPCGKIDLRSDPSNVQDIGEWQNMRKAVKDHVLHPVWTCELWRLSHFDKITKLEREAGDKWIELVIDHRKYINDAPREQAKVSKLERGYGKIDIDLEALETEQKRAIVDANDRLKKKWDAAYCAVVDRRNGVAIMRAVNAVCLEDQPVEYQRLILAKEGLGVLAKHFGLDKRNKT